MGDGTERRFGPVPLPSASPAPSTGHRVGHIIGFEDGHVLVDPSGKGTGAAVIARTTVHLDPTDWQRMAAAHAEALLVFEQGDEHAARPIIVGLLSPQAPAQSATALVDGKRVVIEAADEIVLRCGPASITLRRNGRVVIQGKYVETHSQGVNRIKGGSVQIN